MTHSVATAGPPGSPDLARVGHGPVPLRQAALVIPVRKGPAGPEVFMMQRHGKAAFVPGVHVFPGGAIDPADADAALAVCCLGLNDAAASARLGLPHGGLAYWVGAIRECFEEAGLLLACDPAGSWVRSQQIGLQRWQEFRLALHQGQLSLADLCRQWQVGLALDRLHYLSHWVTPPGQSRRFDTRFFLAEAPEDQAAEHDGQETVASCWIRPAAALDAYQRGDFPLVFATRTTLDLLASFDTTQSLLQHVAQQRQVPAIMPRMAKGRSGVQAVGPANPAYPEIEHLDPEGQGLAFYDIEPGRVVPLAPGVWRLTAPNPGYMTGPGTNTYLLGDASGVTVIDPGPADPAHVQAILAAAPGPLQQVLVTHTHHDHSPAVALLRQHANFQTLGWAARHPGQDASFVPDREPQDGERLVTRAGTLKVIHTPGHAANHLCFLLEPQRLLFTGDHIMQGSTVVINPPDGNMATYLQSLQKLLQEPLDWLAPAHGFLLNEPHRVIRDLITHRLRREALVLRALAEAPEGLEETTLLARVYTPLLPALRPVAARSLQAHLIKLAEEGKADTHDGRWRLSSST